MTANDQHEAHRRLFDILQQENVNDIAAARRRLNAGESPLEDDQKRFLARAARSWRTDTAQRAK
jgi:hypothetical protein